MMLIRILLWTTAILIFLPSPAPACSRGGPDPCLFIHTGMLIIVFGLISEFYKKRIGALFYRSMFLVSVVAYGYYVFISPAYYGGSQCQDVKWMAVLMPLMALIQASQLGYFFFKAKKSPHHIVEGRELSPFRLGFSSIGLLAGTLGLIFFVYSTEDTSHRRYNPYIKSSLHNYFLACNTYWENEGPTNNCSIDIASQPNYGFYNGYDFKIYSIGNQSSFIAFGRHKKGKDVYKIDRKGNIEEVQSHPFPLPPPTKNRWGRFVERVTGGTT